MNVLNGKIEIGVKTPFRIIHVSDTHLTLADERNDGRKIELAERRKNSFPKALAVLDDIKSLYEKTGYFTVHTGDLIDFVSEANLDAAKEFTEATDCFAAAGNHEFSLYVGEAFEDAAYRNKSLARVQEAFKNDIRFSSKIVGGVNFVAVDNSYYLFEKYQLDRLKEEAEKGLPVILCLHTPLYSGEMYNFSLRGEAENTPAYLMSVPEEKMSYYSADRYRQQKEDDITHEAYEFICREPTIKALLVGHLHKSFVLPLGDKMQYGVGCTDARIIEIE